MPDQAKPDDLTAATPSAPDALLRSASVCIVTHEFAGLPGSGGIGTAFAGLAETLVAAGCAVTVLCSGLLPLPPGFERENAEGLTIRRLPPGPLPIEGEDPFLRLSHDAFLWLVERRFDVIHFADWTGLGFFATTAKRQGIAFADTTLTVGLHGPTRWVRSVNGGGLEGPGELAVDFLERRSVELADAVVSPSRHLLDWVCESGWTLPTRADVRQNVQPSPADPIPFASDTPRLVRELVFFGRLETRKGVGLFCDALDRLATQGEFPNLQITFLGGSAPVDGEDGATYVRRRAAGWPWPVAFRHGLSSPEALAYLAGDGRLAVMPSRIENSPCVVAECLIRGLPFLASRVGGTAELIVDEDAAAVLFAPNADALADRLAHVLRIGAVTARLRVAQQEVAADWLAWHAAEAQRARALESGGAPLSVASDTYALLSGDELSLTEGAVERMTAVAQRTGAAIVTGAVDAADGSRRWIAAGGPAALGLWRDVVGPGPLLVRRDRLNALPADPAGQAAALIGRLLDGDRIEVMATTVATMTTPRTTTLSSVERLAPFAAAGGAVADFARLALGLETVAVRAVTERNNFATARDAADAARRRLLDERNRLARALEATVSGGLEDRQRARLSALLASRSWRLSTPLRRRFGGSAPSDLASLPPERAVETILASVWWDLAAPWRLAARAYRRFHRRP